MRNALILMFLTTFQLLADNSYSQDTRLTLTLNDVSVESVLNEIEKQSEFYFLFNYKLVDVKRQVDIDADNEQISDILASMFDENEVEYVLVDRQILLSPKEFNVKKAIRQTLQINGQVMDENGVPLPGATIMVKGTTRGAITNLDGNFSIEVEDETTVLSISFIGYLSQEITVGDQTEITVTLLTDAIGLEEIVVVGYGTATRKDLTGAVGSVRTQEIVRANPLQPAQALQGSVAGVNIQKIAGKPGDGYTIDIRGLSNFDENNEGLNEPLIVIDGVMGGNLNSVNPADIDKIDVLKDASSTAIYGSRGANGVILVTTKKGKSGKPSVSYNSYAGVKMPARIPEMMDAAEFYNTYNVLRVEAGGTPRGWTSTEVANAESGRSVDWIDLIIAPTLQMSHTLSVSGGSENTTYNFSGGYLDEGGNVLNTGYKRYTVSASIESALGDIFKVGFSSYYSRGQQNLVSNEVLRSAYRARPTGTIYYDDLLNPAESNDMEWNGYAVWMGINDKQVLNPMIEIDPENYKRERLSNNLLANAFAEIEPIKGLTFRSSISTAVSDSRDGIFIGTMTKKQKTTLDPVATQTSNKLSTYTWDNILTYKLATGMHRLNVTGLYSVFHESVETFDMSVIDLPYRSLWYNMSTGTITGYGSGLVEKSLLSYMARINYIFMDKIILYVIK